jgi:hypothetical protein
MRPSGFDFLPGGRRAAVCTWDGDVWLVDGIDNPARGLTWQRIASGLFQPLGLKVVEGRISTTAATELEGHRGRIYTTSPTTIVVAPLKGPPKNRIKWVKRVCSCGKLEAVRQGLSAAFHDGRRGFLEATSSTSSVRG